MKALILNDNVVQVEAKEFPVHESLKWMECPADCKAGWHLINGVLTAPEVIPEPKPIKSTLEKKVDALWSAVALQDMAQVNALK